MVEVGLLVFGFILKLLLKLSLSLLTLLIFRLEFLTPLVEEREVGMAKLN